MSQTAKPGDFSTVIGSDAKFKGELSFTGGVKIDGQFEGSIETAGSVLVSKGGKSKAEIVAGNIILEGTVEGGLQAQERIELKSTARLGGDIKASKLVVEEGAVFVGRCEVGGKAPPKSQADDNVRAIKEAAQGRK